MKKKWVYLAAVIMLGSCSKQLEVIKLTPLSDYYPLQVGKYITYNLDSTVFINFGTKDTVISYQVQDRVDSQITDNLGRPAYRIYRYIRKNSSQPWTPNNTFLAIPTNNSIEFVENNLRFLKLVLPIENGTTWKGNSYIDAYSLNSTLKYLDDWDYSYDSVGATIKLGNIPVSNSIKVNQRDEFLGQDPKLPTTQYAEKNYSVEKYAKGVGLVYKEFLHWEFQGTQPGRPAYYTGYGVKLTIIDHN